MNIFKAVSLILFTLLVCDLAHADTVDRAQMRLTYKYKMDMPVDVFVQSNKSKSQFMTFRERWEEKNPRLIAAAERKGCDVDKTFEVRFVAPRLLACRHVIPLEEKGIQYNSLTDVKLLNALMKGAKEEKWRRTQALQEADIALLVELEITNLVNINRRENKVWNTVATNMSAPNYKPMYMLSLKINGINSDPNAEDRLVFNARVTKYFDDYPSDKTLESMMMAAGEKIRKQKNFGLKGANVLRFTNFEDSGK